MSQRDIKLTLRQIAGILKQNNALLNFQPKIQKRVRVVRAA